MESKLHEIRKKLTSLSTPEAHKAILRSVPTAGRIYGVRMPHLNAMAREYRHLAPGICRELWYSGAFEEQMLAVKLLAYIPAKDIKAVLELMDEFRPGLKDWAVCDTLGTQALRKALKNEPGLCLEKAKDYLTTGLPWSIRLGLVILLHFSRDPVNHGMVLSLASPFRNSSEHYTRKALLWLDRTIEKYA